MVKHIFPKPYLTQAFFEPSVMERGDEGPRLIITLLFFDPMIMKLGTGMNRDHAFYTMPTKIVTSLLLRS